MGRPTLHVFAISHYCEKARWALDFHGVDYALRHLAPGPHMQVANELGAPSSLPLLVVGERFVHGSGAILDWAESEAACDPSATESATEGSRRLSPAPELASECSALEQRLDDVAGVHARRYYYSEAIIEHPETVLPMFARDLEPSERQSLEENWAIVCKLMTGAMDLGPAQGSDSRDILAGELDWLDSLLSDGRRYLVGDRFSRADVTAASLLAPLALPKEHPTYGLLQVPPRASADREAWDERPITQWVRKIYREHR
jgi:glutathione S-transferase